MHINDIWPFSATDTANMIAGALGGAVRAAALKLSWRDTSISVFVGCVCAKYLYPFGNAIVDPIVSHLTSSPGETSGLGGFVIGIVGVAGVGFIIELFRLRSAMVRRDAL